MGGPQHGHHHHPPGPAHHHHHHHHHPPAPAPVHHHHPPAPAPVHHHHPPAPVPVHHHHHHQPPAGVSNRGMPAAAPVHATGPRVLFASYGGADVTHKVQQMYAHNNLNIKPSDYNNHFGDPFPGQHKDFVVMAVDNTNQIRVHIAEEGQPLHVSPHGPHHSTPPRSVHGHAKEILLANYAGMDVTHKCREVHHHKGPHMHRSMNDTFGRDPLPDTQKALIVMYLTHKGTTPYRACAYYPEGNMPKLM